ncbi:MAG: cyclophilin-like family protein [Haloarculaceae archaeon]
MSDIEIDVDGHTLSATWSDENPETRAVLADALPLEGSATRWGEELYFTVPVDADPDDISRFLPCSRVWNSSHTPSRRATARR